MNNIQKLVAITLLALTFVGCDTLTGKKDDSGKNNMLILGAFLLSQKSASPETFYQALTSKTESYTASAITFNQQKTWAFNADNTVQTITNYNTGTGSAVGTVASTTTNTFTNGYLTKSVVAATGSTAGQCFGSNSGTGSYTVEYSNFTGKNAGTIKCTPGTTTNDTITSTITYENGLTKTQSTSYSVTTASNTFQAYTYASGVQTDWKYYSGATTADSTKLIFGIETVDNGTTITSTTSTYTAGASKTKFSDVVYTISGGLVTRVLTSNYTAGAVTSSTLDVYAYTGTTSFTKKSYSATGATVATESSTLTSSSQNTYSNGLLTKTENFTQAGASTGSTVYTYNGTNPATKVSTNVGFSAFDSCTAYVFTEATKTVTATTDTGTTTCSGGANKSVKTITHNGLSTTNFNGFTDNIDRAHVLAGKIGYGGNTALISADNSKLFTFLNL